MLVFDICIDAFHVNVFMSIISRCSKTDKYMNTEVQKLKTAATLAALWGFTKNYHQQARGCIRVCCNFPKQLDHTNLSYSECIYKAWREKINRDTVHEWFASLIILSTAGWERFQHHLIILYCINPLLSTSFMNHITIIGLSK